MPVGRHGGLATAETDTRLSSISDRWATRGSVARSRQSVAAFRFQGGAFMRGIGFRPGCHVAELLEGCLCTPASALDASQHPAFRPPLFRDTFGAPEPHRDLAVRGSLRLAFQRQQKLAVAIVPCPCPSQPRDRAPRQASSMRTTSRISSRPPSSGKIEPTGKRTCTERPGYSILGISAQSSSRSPVVEAARGMERADAFERRNRPLGRLHGDRAGLGRERGRQQVGMAEHRLAFGKVPDRPSRRVAGRPAGPANRSGPASPALRLALPRAGGFVPVRACNRAWPGGRQA